MVDFDEPDKFSVVTYVSQFYHLFKDGANGSESDDSGVFNSPHSSPLPRSKMASSSSVSPNLQRANLIAKYGEEIFESKKVSQISDDLRKMAKIDEEEKKS